MRSALGWYGNPVLEVMLLDHDEPTNYEEAMMSPDSAKWLEAMKSEMGSMYENKVWTLIDLPNDRRAIEIKWTFKRKTNADSSVTIYKARLVEKKVFNKVQGVDYDEIFSLVSMLKNLSESCSQLPRLMKSGKWMSKLHSLMDFLKKSCI